MPRLKYYNQTTEQWEYVVVGAQGDPGADGADGATGATGPSGVIEVTAPITNSGTSVAANIGIDLSSYYTSSQVDSAIASVVDSAPSTLNTLNELAAALNDDASFASTVTTALGEKAPIASPTFTGTVVGAPAEPDANANTAKNLGYVGLPQVILNSGNLTLSKAHSGEHIYVTGGSQTITIPANSSVPLEIGTTVVIINGNVTSSIAITTDTLRLVGTATTGTRTLAAYGMATLVKVDATTWMASGNGLT
jgi:hypothetical protein